MDDVKALDAMMEDVAVIEDQLLNMGDEVSQRSIELKSLYKKKMTNPELTTVRLRPPPPPRR